MTIKDFKFVCKTFNIVPMIDYKFEEQKDLFSSLKKLKEITELLRSEQGCPWDRKQTNKSFATYLIDETYEYIDAINNKDSKNREEEFGDLLTNLLMLSTIEEKNEDFDVVSAINEECKKLIRRHPHVFTDSQVAKNSEEVLNIWENVKVDVEGRVNDSEDFFEKVPKSLPVVARAVESQKKASKVGFDWSFKQDVIDKICEELDELIEADTAINRSQDEVEDELGDLLFAVINYSRFVKVDPTVALRRATNKFQNRFNQVNNLCKERNIDMKEAKLSQLDELWEEVKKK